MYGVAEAAREPVGIAAVTVADLVSEDVRLAAGSAQTVGGAVLGTQFDPEVAWPNPPDEWWATPLGRLTGVALGRDPEDADATVSVAAARALLGVSRARVYQLLAEGKLERGPDGRILRASVGAHLRETGGGR